MTTKILKAWGAGCAWRLLLQIGLAILLLGGMVVLIVIIEGFLPPGREELGALILGGGLFAFLALGMGGALAWGVSTYRQRAAQMDAAFTPYGLTGRRYMTIGRQYHGSYQGRQLDIYFYRGPVLDIYLAAAVRTRLGVGLKDRVVAAISGLVNRQPVGDLIPGYENLHIFGADHSWARGLLNDLPVQAVLLRLVSVGSEAGPFEINQVIFNPEALHFNLYRLNQARITPANVAQWLRDLALLAAAVEAQPAPAEELHATRLEQATRTQADALNTRVAAITCGVFAVMGACFLAVMLLLVLLPSGGG